MRTTITLEPDVAARLKELAHRSRSSFSATLDAGLRRGLVSHERAGAVGPFAVEPHSGGFRPGGDQARLN